MLNPAERGIRGNSHMIMQDKNKLQVADFILQWITERVSKRSGGSYRAVRGVSTRPIQYYLGAQT